jgi:predicted amidohydrolase
MRKTGSLGALARSVSPLAALLSTLFAAIAALSLAGCAPAGWSYPRGFDSFTAAQGYDTSDCNAFLYAAAASFSSARDDKAANLAAMDAIVTRVMNDHPETDVVVFHEMCTGWISDASDPAGYFASIAESIPGPSTAAVAAMAASHNVSIVFGLAEVEGSSRYNSQALVKPDGTVVSYRKRGLNDGDRANGCTAGVSSVVDSIRGIPVTFAICSDYQSEAVIADLSTSVAPVVLASLVTSTRLNNDVDFFARALGRWVVYANGGGTQSGGTFPGHVFIADPTGTVHDPQAGAGVYSWARIGVRL